MWLHVILPKAPVRLILYSVSYQWKGLKSASKKTKHSELGTGRSRTQVSLASEHITAALFEALSPTECSVQHRSVLSYTGTHMHNLPPEKSIEKARNRITKVCLENVYQCLDWRNWRSLAFWFHSLKTLFTRRDESIRRWYGIVLEPCY